MRDFARSCVVSIGTLGALVIAACSFNDHSTGSNIDATQLVSNDATADAHRAFDAFVPLQPDAAPSCASDYAPLQGFDNGSQYRFVTDIEFVLSWADAEADCESDGAHLFVLSSADELTALANQTDPDDITSINTWMGVTDLVTTGNFIAVTDEAAPYLPWNTGEPTGISGHDCARLRDATTARTQTCTTTYAYVCECDGRHAIAANYTPSN